LTAFIKKGVRRFFLHTPPIGLLRYGVNFFLKPCSFRLGFVSNPLPQRKTFWQLIDNHCPSVSVVGKNEMNRIRLFSKLLDNRVDGGAVSDNADNLFHLRDGRPKTEKHFPFFLYLDSYQLFSFVKEENLFLRKVGCSEEEKKQPIFRNIFRRVVKERCLYS